jgi:hypothetical protein
VTPAVSSRLAPALAAALVLAAGCGFNARKTSIGYFLDAQALAASVHSATLLPLKNETGYPSITDGMTGALFQAVQGRQMFHLVVAGDGGGDRDPAPGATDVRGDFALKELARMRQAFGTDAVLVGAINQFHPYPRMKIGLYLRLVDLRDSRVLWAVDHVWDATDQETQRRIAYYFAEHKGEGYDPLNWQLTTVSPAVFQQFIAFEVASTLPGRSRPN